MILSRIHLLIIVFFLATLSFAAPALAQDLPNPPVATCGLPARGSIYATVTYTLTTDCTQTGPLIINDDVHVTIVGMGYTITVPATTFFVNNFGPLTMKNVTINGGGGSGSYRVIASAGGNLTISDVTFRNSTGIVISASTSSEKGGTHSLTNVLFENLTARYNTAGAVGSAVNASYGAVITLKNTVIRDTLIGNAAISTESNGTVTLTGCLSTQRIFPQLLYRQKSTSITDSSTGACSGTIGNNDQAVRQITPPAPAACGLPPQGFLGQNAVYNLRSNCQQTGTLWIPKGVRVTINGYGRVIGGGSFYMFRSAGRLTIRGAVISDSTTRPMATYLNESSDGGRLLVEHSTFRNNRNSILLIDNTATFNKVIFEDNETAETHALAASVLLVYKAATVNINNSVFRNNSGGNGVIFTGDINPANPLRSKAIVRLCRNTIIGNSPNDDIHNSNNTKSENTNCPDDGTGPGAPPPSNPPSPPKPASKPAAAESTPMPDLPPTCESTETVDAFPIGVIACIFRSGNGSDTVLDIYGVDANSNGFYILSVTQKQVEAAVGETAIGVSADGRVLVLVSADGNVTVKVGPNAEGKILHTIFDGGLFGSIIGTPTTYGDAPGLPYLRAAAAPQVAAVQNCMVTTTHILNFRDAPGGNVIRAIPYNATLTVLARSPGWFQVDYHGEAGWLSADYVVPQEGCG